MRRSEIDGYHQLLLPAYFLYTETFSAQERKGGRVCPPIEEFLHERLLRFIERSADSPLKDPNVAVV